MHSQLRSIPDCGLSIETKPMANSGSAAFTSPSNGVEREGLVGALGEYVGYVCYLSREKRAGCCTSTAGYLGKGFRKSLG